MGTENPPLGSNIFQVVGSIMAKMYFPHNLQLSVTSIYLYISVKTSEQ